jgi:ParB-like chromosome segregation protein Spo0J
MVKSALNGATTPAVARWPALKVEKRAVAKLKPYERNARTHTPAQITEVARSITEWGWTMPVLVDENDGIIAGHARVMAALQLKLAEVPVVVARHWTSEQKRSYIIADNKIGLNAGWDWELLALEVGDLRSLTADLSLMGFTPLEVSSLLAEPTEGERHLADTDPAEDATWPTLEIKMPPLVFDQVRSALDAVAGAEYDWRRLAILLDIEVGDG